ncbi:MAG: AAA family ATPase [Actinobacteria bacterium]|nr:AAA family ATPase [Actinomycetota bacterium]
MYVKELVVQNIKGYRESSCFRFSPSLNYIVGNNNCGKSTVFEAVMFIAGAKYDPSSLFSKEADGPSRVELTLAGTDLADRVAGPKFVKLKDYLHTDVDGDTVLRVERSTEARQVDQGGRAPASLDVKKLCFWHPERAQFENPTGIDALFKALIEFEPVWANVDPSDTADLGTTKVLGRLLSAVTKPFYETAVWKSFADAHGAAFGDDEGSLADLTRQVAGELGELVRSQYGEASARFDFAMPDAAAFIKAGVVQVDDGGIETPLGDKGTGMQRAFALAIIQLWAKYSSQIDDDEKPLVLLVDEPETWLHPAAQQRLAGALAEIAQRQQIFVITHSPYLLWCFGGDRHQLVVLESRGSGGRVLHSSDLGGLSGPYPSLGEITHRAFGICTEGFHNELYGIVAAHLSDRETNPEAGEKAIDDFLVERGLTHELTWKRANGRSFARTLPVYIRNTIHHPENGDNAPFTQVQLAESTAELLRVIGEIRVGSGRVAAEPEPVA